MYRCKTINIGSCLVVIDLVSSPSDILKNKELLCIYISYGNWSSAGVSSATLSEFNVGDVLIRLFDIIYLFLLSIISWGW